MASLQKQKFQINTVLSFINNETIDNQGAENKYYLYVYIYIII